MERIFPEKRIGFLESPIEKTPKIFIPGSATTELYYSSSNDKISCSSEYKEGQVTSIQRKCEKKYVPLKERTKTLADLKREDSTENRERAEPYIQRYENRRKRIMRERLET